MIPENSDTLQPLQPIASVPGSAEPEMEKTEKNPEEKKNKKDKERSREITSMYRAASRNHVAFVAIGDRRANILIGICSVIISVTFSLLLHRLQEPALYLVPAIMLILTCTATMVLAIISTRPYNAKGFYTMDEIVDQNVNLLFFENFYKMKVDDYEAAMDKILNDELSVRHALVRDLHSLGISVARKYRFLRISYDILMYGVVLSVLGFLVTILFNL